MPKRVAIIGAGASGLASIKSCLESGLEPVCFEKNSDIGGLWRYEKDDKNGATVYKSTHINTSKEMMCYSDFPMPREWPNFLHNTKVQEYFNLYAKKFDLLKYIEFGTEVLSCSPSKDYEESGNWLLTTKCSGSIKSEVFRAVMVCVGHHSTPNYPLHAFKGIHEFQGSKTHSHSYRTHHKYEDKKVLVVGIGNSGGDIAVELSWHAKRVFLSTRRGSWVFNRVADRGIPVDFIFTTRFRHYFSKLLPSSFVNSLAESDLNKRFDHRLYGLKPRHRILEQHPTVNDDLPNRILNGSVKIKADVQEFSSGAVRFIDGSIEEIDSVVFATGYDIGFPFLDESVVKMKGGDCDLYKYMWPLNLSRNTLSVIGHIQPWGAINTISEIQSRWAVRVFKGLEKLPSNSAMKCDVDLKRKTLQGRYYKSLRHTVQVDYVDYMDEIACQFGVKPDIAKILFTDVRLGWKLLTEGSSPYQYRLKGPNKSEKARTWIMGQKARVMFPLQSRKVDEGKASYFMTYFIVAVLSVMIHYYFA